MGSGIGVTAVEDIGDSGEGSGVGWTYGVVGSEVGATGSGAVDSGVETGLCSGVGSAVESEAGAGFVLGIGSGAGCGVILFGDPCPLGVKLLLSMMLLYYTFYV